METTNSLVRSRKVTYEQLNQRYEEITAKVVCRCVLFTRLVGGVPATVDGLRAFAEYHLGLTGQELEDAVKRMMKEEIGTRDLPEPEGELEEKLTYGVNVIRRTVEGPYLGNWMVHACLKVAASRVGLFVQHKGAKGNFAEAGRVLPSGRSKLSENMTEVYLRAQDGIRPPETYWDEFRGRVRSGPGGSKSIIHHSECAPVGTLFDFTFNFLKGDVTDGELDDMLGMVQVVGVGSAKAFSSGKLRILEAEIFEPLRKREKKEKEKKARTAKVKERTVKELEKIEADEIEALDGNIDLTEAEPEIPEPVDA